MDLSRFTTQLRWICEVASGVNHSEDDRYYETLELFEGSAELAKKKFYCTGYNDVAQIIADARQKIFKFSYPIFDESYREVLETKILKHYYTQEIAFETVGRWLLALDSKMNEIMPYYNKFYKSELLQFDPLKDTDYKRVHTLEKEGTLDADGSSASETNSRDHLTSTRDGNSSSATTDSSKRRHSDTPQGALTGVESDRYLTDATLESGNSDTDSSLTETFQSDDIGKVSVDGTTTRNENTTGKEDFDEHVNGKMGTGTYSKYLSEFRETFLNIDMMIIDELEELFFGLWGCANDSEFQCSFTRYCGLDSNCGEW